MTQSVQRPMPQKSPRGEPKRADTRNLRMPAARSAAAMGSPEMAATGFPSTTMVASGLRQSSPRMGCLVTRM
jgi:hypothetical protein